MPVPVNPAGAAAGGGGWWGGQRKPIGASGITEELFPPAGKKPGVFLPKWLRPWLSAEANEEATKQCPVPLPTDPTQAPGDDWEWRGKGQPGSDRGAWYNPGTGESLHPDMNHPAPIGPHWDYKDPQGNRWRVDPATGTMTPK